MTRSVLVTVQEAARRFLTEKHQKLLQEIKEGDVDPLLKNDMLEYETRGQQKIPPD